MRVTVVKGGRSVTLEAESSDFSYGNKDIGALAERAMNILERLDYKHYGDDSKTKIPIKEEEWRELDIEGRFVDVDDRQQAQ